MCTYKGEFGLKKLIQALFLLSVLISIYIGGMFAAYSIPDDLLSKRTAHEVKQLNDREAGNVRNLYPKIGLGPRTQLDLFTDRVMLQNVIQKSDSVLQRAMIPAYPRYWHGYQVFLRPLLLVTPRRGICVAFAVLFLGLIVAACKRIKKKLGADFCLIFLLALFSSYCFTAPLSMQYMNVYILTLTAIILINDKEDCSLLFLVIGSLVNFFDFLTFPLMSLTIPLVVLLLFKMKRDDYTLQNGVNTLTQSAVFWGIGYGFTWLAKWTIATPLLNVSVLRDAINASLFRMAGNAEFPANRYKAIQRNLRALLLNVAPEAWLVILVILLIVLHARHILPPNWQKVLQTRFTMQRARVIPLLLVAFFPYFWYLFMANHSQVHYWFTFRSQAGTVLAFSSIVYFLYVQSSQNDVLIRSLIIYWNQLSQWRKCLIFLVIIFLLWC